jgi:hypothetical protein
MAVSRLVSNSVTSTIQRCHRFSTASVSRNVASTGCCVISASITFMLARWKCFRAL